MGGGDKWGVSTYRGHLPDRFLPFLSLPREHLFVVTIKKLGIFLDQILLLRNCGKNQEVKRKLLKSVNFNESVHKLGAPSN